MRAAPVAPTAVLIREFAQPPQLSDREHSTLALIAARRLTQSPFPTLREIAREIGAKDKTTAARIIQTLRRRELIGAAA